MCRSGAVDREKPQNYDSRQDEMKFLRLDSALRSPALSPSGPPAGSGHAALRRAGACARSRRCSGWQPCDRVPPPEGAQACGLVAERKNGRWVHIALAEEPEARAWLETALAAVVDDPQLASDARLVDELRRLPVEELCRTGLDGARRKVPRQQGVDTPRRPR